MFARRQNYKSTCGNLLSNSEFQVYGWKVHILIGDNLGEKIQCEKSWPDYNSLMEVSSFITQSVFFLNKKLLAPDICSKISHIFFCRLTSLDFQRPTLSFKLLEFSIYLQQSTLWLWAVSLPYAKFLTRVLNNCVPQCEPLQFYNIAGHWL